MKSDRTSKVPRVSLDGGGRHIMLAVWDSKQEGKTIVLSGLNPELGREIEEMIRESLRPLGAVYDGWHTARDLARYARRRFHGTRREG